MITLIISNKSISCIEWGKDIEGFTISQVVDEPYYKKLLLANNPGDIIAEAFEAFSPQIRFLGQEVEVLIDDGLVLTSALTVDEGLSDEEINAYLQWWINQSWPESADHYVINYFRPETDTTFIWLCGIQRTVLETIRQSLIKVGARFNQCAPVSATLISLNYPKNSIWTFIESRSYQLMGCVGSLPFQASISFYSGEIRSSAIIGDAKTVEPLLEGPSYRTPFQFVEPIPDGRKDVWTDIPTQVHSLIPDIEAFGEEHGWKRDLRRNLGVLSAVISADATNRIINFLEDKDSSQDDTSELDRRLARLKRLEQEAEREASSGEAEPAVVDSPPDEPKKSSKVIGWVVVLILLLGGAYYFGFMDSLLERWLKPRVSVQTEEPTREADTLSKESSTGIIQSFRNTSYSMLDYLEKSDETAFTAVDGNVVIDSDSGAVQIVLKRNDVALEGRQVLLATVLDSIHQWELGAVKSFPLSHYGQKTYSPLIVKLYNLKDARLLGRKVLGLGDNVVFRKISVDNFKAPPTVYFYIAVF